MLSLAWWSGGVTSAINLGVGLADIERALAIGRGTASERQRFHAPYLVRIDSSAAQGVEIVTEFRRFVLYAEAQIQKGSRLDAFSTRLATEAISPWKNRVSVTGELRFHPQNTYVDVPKIEISLDGPGAEQALIGVLREPVLSLPSPVVGDRLPILGARAEGVFDASIVGQTRRTAVIRIDGKEVARALLDFARVE